MIFWKIDSSEETCYKCNIKKYEQKTRHNFSQLCTWQPLAVKSFFYPSVLTLVFTSGNSMLFFVQHYLFLPILWGRGYVIFPFFYAYWELIVLDNTKFSWKVKIFAETSNILFCIWTRKTSLFHLDLNKPCMRVFAATSYSLMAISVI